MIRAVGREHAEAVAELERSAAAWPWTPGAVEDSLARPTTLAWVAYDEDRPVGHLLTTLAADTAEVLSVAVHPQARRRGWASRLLATCVEAWREQQVAEAFLEVRAGNAAAIGLYERSGWQRVGRRAAYYPDGEDAIVMRWEPGPC